MRQHIFILFAAIFFIPFLSGCSAIGSKSSSMSVIYGFTSIFSFLILLGYRFFNQNRQLWFYILFSSVFVVNTGYYFLSAADTLQAALWANRISYLGSVFLPLSMLMILFHVIRIDCPKWIMFLLISVGIIVFLIAASPGYLPIYYKEVSLEMIDGVSVLNKVYGPWHKLYLFYLLGYAGAMTAAVIYMIRRKKMDSAIHAAVLAVAVLGNFGVWLTEQLISIDFEILSISYIISELFLLGLHLILTEQEKLKKRMAAEKQASQAAIESAQAAARSAKEAMHAALAEIQKSEQTASCQKEQTELFFDGLNRLTQTEHIVYNLYTDGKRSKEIMEILQIKENTLKYHNKNIYSKLGVSSRKELLELANTLKKGSAD